MTKINRLNKIIIFRLEKCFHIAISSGPGNTGRPIIIPAYMTWYAGNNG